MQREHHGPQPRAGPAGGRYPVRVPVVLLWLVTGALAGYAGLRLDPLFELPVAPDGEPGKQAFLVMMIGAVVLLAAAFTALGLWLPRSCDRIVSVPHRDYWLAPARRAESKAWLGRHVLVTGVATQLFVAPLFCLVIEVFGEDGPYPGLADFVSAGVFVGVVVVAGIVFNMILRFRRPRADAPSSP
jgi:hypothetical protein